MIEIKWYTVNRAYFQIVKKDKGETNRQTDKQTDRDDRDNEAILLIHMKKIPLASKSCKYYNPLNISRYVYRHMSRSRNCMKGDSCFPNICLARWYKHNQCNPWGPKNNTRKSCKILIFTKNIRGWPFTKF